MDIFKDKKILVTGATGSWGQTLVRILLEETGVREIICLSRGELQQVLMQRRFNDPRLKFIIGDVRDYSVVKFACRGVDLVFHMAALKHVPVCEDNPQEAIKTNIDGTTNIVNAAIECGVSKVVDVSTDKAVEPLNLYGMTKAVGEKLILQANDLSDKTKFVCVRGGNVLGSNGSVVPLFIDQIKRRQPLTITHREMTRFFLTLEEAIRLVLKATLDSIGGETFVMNMPAYYIKDIAEVLMVKHGMVDITYSGIKPGEKLDEVLISQHEAKLSHCWGEHYYVILPMKHNTTLMDRYGGQPPVPFKEFTSRTKLLDIESIPAILQRGGFI